MQKLTSPAEIHDTFRTQSIQLTIHNEIKNQNSPLQQLQLLKILFHNRRFKIIIPSDSISKRMTLRTQKYEGTYFESSRNIFVYLFFCAFKLYRLSNFCSTYHRGHYSCHRISYQQIFLHTATFLLIVRHNLRGIYKFVHWLFVSSCINI